MMSQLRNEQELTYYSKFHINVTTRYTTITVYERRHRKEMEIKMRSFVKNVYFTFLTIIIS